MNSIISNTDGFSTLEINYRYFSLMTIQSLISIPFIIVGFLALGGLFYVFKKLVHQEGDIFLVKDFFFGIKDNIKSSLLSGIIFSLFTCLYVINIYFYPCVDNMNSAFKIVMYVLVSLIYFAIIFLSLFLLTSGTIYKFSFKDTLKNNLMLSFCLYPLNLLFALLSLIFFILYIFIPYMLIEIILLAIIFIYGFAHLGLTFTLYSFSIFDKYINKRYQTDIVKKGLDNSTEGD